MTEAGSGINLFTAGEVKGTARWFRGTSDVLAVDEGEVDGLVAFVERGGITFLSPILPDLAGVVCLAGSRESHLAIISREYGVPCVMAAELSGEVSDGDRVTLDLSDPETGRIAVTG